MSDKKEQAAAAESDSTEIEVEHLDTQPEDSENRDVLREDAAENPDRNAEPSSRESEPQPSPDWEDRYLRLAAEFDNYKKRSARDFARIIKTAESDLILDLTEVLDNFERALNPEHRNGELGELVKGIELTYEQLKAVLEKRGLTRMKSIGEPFDPEKHEAMMQMDSDDIPEDHVAGEIAVGYELGDKVLRHAKVIVSRGPARDEDEKEE